MISSTERRTFSIDHAIIFQHIFGSQRTDTCGAFCELIQNSFDSKSSVVNLNITERGFSIVDDGEGFRDKESIYTWFEVFGAQKAEENDRLFSQFRMGRGQVMGICSTTWHTHNFLMHVDIKNKGLDYDLCETAETLHGCKIVGDWYEDITKHYYSYNEEKTPAAAIKHLIEKISSHCKYIFGMDIFINGVRINKDVNAYDWDVDSEDHYFKKASTLSGSYRSGMVNVYNMGMLVQTLYDRPSAGDLISKIKLRINVTRNSVQADCPVYINMLRTLVSCKPKLHPNVKYTTERASGVLQDFIEGVYTLEEIAHLKLFCDIHRSRHKSLTELAKMQFTIADGPDSKSADRVDQAGRVFVVHYETFSFIRHIKEGEDSNQRNVRVANELLGKIFEFSKELNFDLFQAYNDFEECVEAVSGENLILGPTELTNAETRFLDTLNLAQKRYRGTLKGINYRSFMLGSSVQLSAWTDSENFICLHRKFANELKFGIEGALKIASIILHECCHVKDSDTHDHNFYRNFHDIVCDRNVHFYLAKLILVAHDDVLFENKIKGTPSFIKSVAQFRRGGEALCAQKHNKPESVS